MRDLSKLNRDLSKVLFVTADENALSMQPENAVKVGLHHPAAHMHALLANCWAVLLWVHLLPQSQTICQLHPPAASQQSGKAAAELGGLVISHLLPGRTLNKHLSSPTAVGALEAGARGPHTAGSFALPGGNLQHAQGRCQNCPQDI